MYEYIKYHLFLIKYLFPEVVLVRVLIYRKFVIRFFIDLLICLYALKKDEYCALNIHLIC